jgi:oligoendopeptidase F
VRRLSPDEIGGLWVDAQRKLFGDAVEIPDLYRLGWIYIPHFVHAPFYCYSYSFGHLLVLALFERFREEGPAFVPSYLALLEGGGSDSPERLLGRIGIDVTRPEFWDTGFRTIARLIAELEGTLTGPGRPEDESPKG